MALTRIANIASTIPDDSIANIKMANIVQSKNIIINGDMQVSQRSTSTASVTTVGYYTVDRMQWIADYGTVTLSQDTDVPSGYGFANSFKADVTTAGTVVSAGYVLLRQKIEGQNLQYLKKGTSSAQSLTLSFWIKSTKTGTYIAELYDADNTRQISKSYTVSASNTWEKKTITFAGDTTGAFGNDNAASLFVNLYLSAGSDYTSGTLNTSWAASTNANRVVGQVDAQDNTSNNIYFTGIQLEAGDTASEFEFLPFDLNWLRCFRYCLAIGNAPGGTTYNYADNSIIGYYYNGTDFYPNYFYPVPMRATPSVTFSGTGSGLGVVYSDNAGDTTTSNGTNVTSNTNLNFRCSTSQSNQTYGGAFDFSADQYALLSAEL
jgi:hypothetical protein